MLKEFARYLKTLDPRTIAIEQLKVARRLDLPLMRLFAHLPEPQLLEMGRAGVVTLLDDLERGTALDAVRASLAQWEEDRLPGIPKGAIGPADLTLTYLSQKQTLLHFLPGFSHDPETIIQVVIELGEYVARAQMLAMEVLLRLREEEAERGARLAALQQATQVHLDEVQAANRELEVQRAELEQLTQDLHGSKQQLEAELARNTAIQGELKETAAENARLFHEAQQAESELRELNATLERRVAERTGLLEATNKELEAFSYSVSHDLRAPLRAIDGFSQALEEDYADKVDDTGKDYLHRIRAASQRMAQLIEDLLQFSRLTRGEIVHEKVDLSALAREVAQSLQQGQPARQVEWVIPDGLVAEGDPRLLRVVLDNLFSNAFKFTSRHATARIALTRGERDGKPTYCVSDNGAGFDMAYAGKLFTPFQRLHTTAEFPGTGIGLATVQRIIHRHGGRIWAEAAPEKGATFCFTLG